MKLRYTTATVVLAQCRLLLASGAPPEVHYSLPDQYSQTLYAGPMNLWHDAASILLPKDAGAMGGIKVSREGILSGALIKVTEARDLDFVICEIPDDESANCDGAVRFFNLHVRVLPRPRTVSLRSSPQNVAVLQYAGQEYRGPKRLSALIQGRAHFSQVNPAAESAGITVDDKGQLSGQVDLNFRGNAKLTICEKQDESGPCLQQFQLVFPVEKSPEFRNPDIPSDVFVAGNPIAPNRSPDPAHSPIIRDTLSPGQKEIYANASPSLDSGAQTRVYPFINGRPAGLLDGSGNPIPYATTDSKGQAYLRLQTPLAPDEEVRLIQQTISGKNVIEPPPVAPEKTEKSVVSDPLDLGRARYYFTSGVVLSNSQQFALQSSSTQAGVFLDLTADRAWAWSSQPKFSRWGVNSFFDARLTSVATQSTATLPQSTSAPASGATSTGSNFSGQSSPILEPFIRSQKAAILQIGGYLPFRVSDWPIGPSKYGFFVAPLAKAGFTTLTDNQQSALSGDTGRFFTSYSFGSRLDLSQLYFYKDSTTVLDKSRAPRSIGYLDITVGRFGNFEAFRDLTAEQSGSAATHNYLFVRPWRYSFEGFLKIPRTVFLVG